MAPAAPLEACTRCGTFIRDPREVLYSVAGDKVCPGCFELGELDLAKDGYARTVRNGGYAAPFFAAVAIMSTLVFSALAVLLVAVAALSAGGVLIAMVRDPVLRQKIGWHVVPAGISAAFALLVSVVFGLFFLLGMGLLVAS
jgi:hypothetical protein